MKNWDNGGCFVAGTAVHTANGLVPIERVQIGDLVLSQSERGGGPVYKKVVNTFIHLEKKIVEVIYWLEDEPDTEYSVFATENHRLWVNEIGWTRVDQIDSGTYIQLADRRSAYVISAHPVYRTNRPNICWAASDESGFDGRLLDCSDDFAILQDAHYVQSLMPTDGGDPYFRATVYNIEVEDSHTYYVGPNGVWVHNDR